MILFSRAPKKKKKPLEFAQKIALLIVVFSMFIVFFTICLNFVLLWFDHMGMPQETIQTISVFGGITATAGTVVYGALAGWRDHSKNTTKVTHLEMEQANSSTPVPSESPFDNQTDEPQ